MHILDIFRITWRYRWVILITILVPVIAAMAFTQTRPVKYTTSIAFTVNRVNNTVNTTEYQYDGYYALQASDLFTDTVVSWFVTPSVIVEIYQASGVPANVTNLTSLTSRFTIKKYSSQNLVVKYNAPSQDEAGKLASAITKAMETKASQLNLSADKKALFEVSGATPLTVLASKQLPLVGVVALVIGVFLSVLLVGLLHSFKNSRPTGAAPIHS